MLTPGVYLLEVAEADFGLGHGIGRLPIRARLRAERSARCGFGLAIIHLTVGVLADHSTVPEAVLSASTKLSSSP